MVAGLVALATLAWIVIVRMAASMEAMDSHAAMAVPQAGAWGAADFAALFAMWTVMMVAMMLPSASPVVLVVAGIFRRRGGGGPLGPTALFVLGYLTAWTGYSAAAATAQILLHNAALLSPAMVSASPILGGVLLLAAGLFQWTPLKGVCLTHCRSPLHFLAAHWREGRAGAVRMGLEHGAYCVGCCWLLMALLFVAGVMNLLWVAALAAFVLLEKVVPRGDRLGRAVGVLLVVAGGRLLADPLL